MYSLVSATVLENAPEAQYSTVDLSQTPINVIYAIYSEVYLTLSNPYLTSNVYVYFNDLKPQLSGFQGLISQWLGNIGNLTLPTVPSIPTPAVAYARYSDATHAGYKANVCQIGFQTPLNYPIDLLPDLQISRPNYTTDLSLINKYCLATVNGFLHQTDYDGTYAYIQKGAVTMRKSNMNLFGFLSFLDIGQVSTFAIAPSSVYADTSNGTAGLSQKMYLNIGQDVTGKSVALSLGGYLVLPDPGIFYQVGTSTFCLNTNALPLLARFFESSQYLDLTSLGLDNSILNPNLINAAQLLSDATLLKYLELPQSFWIVIDSPTLYYTPEYIESSHLPGNFIAYTRPINPLIVGYGRMAEYWTTYEDGQYSVHVDRSFLMQYQFLTNPNTQSQNVDSAVLPWRPYYDSIGYTLMIHT
jgi:hypothetical protein